MGVLLVQATVTPFVVSQWVSHPFWAFVLTFIPIFVLWCLNFLAGEMENPYGRDAHDLDKVLMQEELNHQLLLLLRPGTCRIPKLHGKAQDLAKTTADFGSTLSSCARR